MQFPDRKTVERLRKIYPPGTVVELVRMEDKFSPPVGTRGVVIGVDDAGSVMVRWTNGSSLSVIYGVDEARKVEEV
jgi:hypothetical protein